MKIYKNLLFKDSRYKLFWSGNNKGTAGVGVFVAEKWIEKVFEVKRVSDRIILVKIIVGQRVLCLLSVYAPQCGLSDSVKDLFYDQLNMEGWQMHTSII